MQIIISTIVELANQITDNQVDKSTYQTWFDVLFTCNHANGILTRMLASNCSAFKEITAGS